ncbi:hypothetical protein LL033_14265 [Clostridium estertheticum]|nr:hypothetical protein [Clostridium estertheticum]MBU3213941.1 hypothetical protein [Clostridium estertheticum]WAG53818.1 hypothetical protein LL033_14265 [Clostridium estertheticum]
MRTITRLVGALFLFTVIYYKITKFYIVPKNIIESIVAIVDAGDVTIPAS